MTVSFGVVLLFVLRVSQSASNFALCENHKLTVKKLSQRTKGKMYSVGSAFQRYKGLILRLRSRRKCLN